MQTVFSVSCQRRKSNLICQNSPEVISDFEPINVQFQIKVLSDFQWAFTKKIFELNLSLRIGMGIGLQIFSYLYDVKDFWVAKNLMLPKLVHTSPDQCRILIIINKSKNLSSYNKVWPQTPQLDNKAFYLTAEKIYFIWPLWPWLKTKLNLKCKNFTRNSNLISKTTLDL